MKETAVRKEGSLLLFPICVVQSFGTSFLKDIHETSRLLIIFNDALETIKNHIKVTIGILAYSYF